MSDFKNIKISTYASKTVNKRIYFINPFPNDSEMVNEVFFSISYPNQNKIFPWKTYCVDKSIDLAMFEMLIANHWLRNVSVIRIQFYFDITLVMYSQKLKKGHLKQ